MPDVPEERQISDFTGGGGSKKAEAPPLPEKLLLELSAAQQSFRLQPGGGAASGTSSIQVSREASAPRPREAAAEVKPPSLPPAAAGELGSVLGQTSSFLRKRARFALLPPGV